ncbi:MAG TPA: SpoIIE family protein phosphatase [Candidatus Angelobacter sp.]|jgi:serine phosphatase RsbU (regulator of sigma subunit)|nr:SpoIIE family protein phosphatase [Candidatus Angelobacter sp.]
MPTAPTTPVAPGEVEILVEAAGRVQKVPVSKLPFTIGRLTECDLVIPDARVSRVHANLVSEKGDYFIVDGGSLHGTFVNGSRCTRTRLKDGDQITLGAADLKLVFLASGPANKSNVLLSQMLAESDSSDLEKLRLFLEAARSLSSGLVVNDVLRNMLAYALRLTLAERGFVYLREKDGATTLACGLDSKGNSISAGASVSRSVVKEAMSSASEFIIGDTSQQSALAGRESIVLNELRMIIAIPLRGKRLSSPADAPAEADGVLYLDSRFASRNLSGVSHEVLRALANECAAVLESAKLVEAEQAARQYHQEMAIAASIQRSLISEHQVQCDFAQVNGRSIPCKEVGGDFFDVYVSPEAVTAIVADVSGKGISAALLASVIHGMFYSQLSSGAALVDTAGSVNQFLCSRVAGQKYATLLAVQLQRNGKLGILNCGHVPAIVAANGKVSQITDGDLPLGLLADAQFHLIEQQLSPGSRVCMITDGITESEDTEGSEFGMLKVEEHVGGADPVGEILAAVQSFCNNHEAQDDRTVLVLERTG